MLFFSQDQKYQSMLYLSILNSEFVSFASGTLEEFVKRTNDIKFAVLLQTCERFGMSPLMMAFQFNSDTFISDSNVQQLITDYWLGHNYEKTKFRNTRILVDNLTFGFFHTYLKPSLKHENVMNKKVKLLFLSVSFLFCI